MSKVFNNLIYSAGTQVVVMKPVQGTNGKVLHPIGSVGIVAKAPQDQHHPYRIKFIDDFEAPLHHEHLILLSEYKQGEIGNQVMANYGLFDRVIFRCVIGSRAYGLNNEDSDTDRRGIYLPPATSHWSLYGVPEQIENDLTQEAYWEIQKFLVIALKANPNVLECLYSPIVEVATPLAQELLDKRNIFLSKIVFQTYNGYVMSQFKKIQTDIKNQGKIKWKHVMHLIRLLLSGIMVLKEGFVPVKVEEHRDALLAIRSGNQDWDEINRWRLDLHRQFEQAFEQTKLPEKPNYEQANQFLIKARRLSLEEVLP